MESETLVLGSGDNEVLTLSVISPVPKFTLNLSAKYQFRQYLQRKRFYPFVGSKFANKYILQVSTVVIMVSAQVPLFIKSIRGIDWFPASRVQSLLPPRTLL